MCRFSLVVASGGYSLLQCTGFLLRFLVLLQSMGSRHVGFSSCGSWAVECRLSSCGAQSYLLHGMCDLLRPGLEPMFPALADGFLNTAPPGKSLSCISYICCFIHLILFSPPLSPGEVLLKSFVGLLNKYMGAHLRDPNSLALLLSTPHSEALSQCGPMKALNNVVADHWSKVSALLWKRQSLYLQFLRCLASTSSQQIAK